MLSTREALKLRIYIRTKKGRLKKYGKVHAVVFHPSRPQVVGVSVKRPDFLLMKKRKDRFVAIDRLRPCEGGLEVVDEADSWDRPACKRLGVEYDQCIIWDYMPVRTLDGTELGLVKEVFCDGESFRIDHIDISESSADKAILGATRIPASMLEGYRDGAIVVSDEAKAVEEAGGLAAKAGEAWAKTKHDAGEAGKKAGAAASSAADKAVNEGAAAVGKKVGEVRKKMNDAVDEHEAKKEAEQAAGTLTGVDKAANALGHQLNRASHMFKDFKDEFDKASGK